MPVWLGVCALAALAIVFAIVILTATALAQLRAETQALTSILRRDLGELQARLDAADAQARSARTEIRHGAERTEYTITSVGDSDASADRAERDDAPTVAAPLFADIVARESVVHAVSLAAGLRRALSAENRHRIRFEMRREVKRARKDRRTVRRQAQREVAARQRGGIGLGEPS